MVEIWQRCRCNLVKMSNIVLFLMQTDSTITVPKTSPFLTQYVFCSKLTAQPFYGKGPFHLDVLANSLLPWASKPFPSTAYVGGPRPLSRLTLLDKGSFDLAKSYVSPPLKEIYSSSPTVQSLTP